METELTFEQLYEDLVSASTTNVPDKFFTIKQFMSDTGLSYWLSRKRLLKMVDDGELETMKSIVDGNSVRIWWFSDERNN